MLLIICRVVAITKVGCLPNYTVSHHGMHTIFVFPTVKIKASTHITLVWSFTHNRHALHGLKP